MTLPTSLPVPHPVRQPPLAPAVTRVQPLPPASRIALRVRDAETDAVTVAAGFDLSGPLNTARGTPERFAARLGPDEWLLVAPDREAEAIMERLAADLGSRVHSIVDVGHRNVALRVEGPDMRAVLAGGIALDLDDTAFPEGTATRTRCGKAEIVLLRVPGDGAFRVECWRSFAPYVASFLGEVAREFG